MLNVEVQADGTLTGNPIAGRPGEPATHTANALYMLESGTNASKPTAAPTDPSNHLRLLMNLLRKLVNNLLHF